MKCKRWMCAFAAMISGGLLASAASNAQECTYEHTYIGNRPKEESRGWHRETQGLTHDDSNWFITELPSDRFVFSLDEPFPAKCNTGGNCPDPTLWRIPAGWGLSTNATCGNPQDADAASKPVCASLSEVAPDLWWQGYDHYGDPGYFDHDGKGYVCVPLEGGLNLPGPGVPGVGSTAALAFFRSEDLSYAGHVLVPGQDLTAAWCAIDPSGYVYSSGRREDSRVDSVFKYRMEWERLSEDPPVVEFELVGTLPLRDESGEPLSLHTHMQGGTFSEDGELLYLVNGTGRDDCDCGIHVFEVRHVEGGSCGAADGDCNTRRIAKSRNGKGAFNFQFNPGFWTYEEPEGITWWDLSAPGAPFVDEVTTSGTPMRESQLHVVLLDNNAGTEEVYIKHYRVESMCAPQPGIAISPGSLYFEQVDVGGNASELLSIWNTGDSDLTLNVVQIRAGGTGPDFDMPSPPSLPSTISPGGETTVEVRFTPSAAGLAQGVLDIESNDPNTPRVAVRLVGEGVSLVDQARRLLEVFDEGVANRLLEGTGRGNSAEHRRSALRAMLEEAQSLLEDDFVSEACGQLHAALIHSDGAENPGDFVAGSAAPVIAKQIRELRDHMGCRDPGRWSCGLGFELALLLPPVLWWRSRRRRPARP